MGTRTNGQKAKFVRVRCLVTVYTSYTRALEELSSCTDIRASSLIAQLDGRECEKELGLEAPPGAPLSQTYLVPHQPPLQSG